MNNKITKLISAICVICGLTFAQNYSLSFDGVDDWVEFNPNGLPQGNSNHTISSWVYVTPVTGERQWVLILGNPGTGAHHWLINNNTLNLGRWNGGSTALEPIFNEWFCLTVTYDGNYTKSYINGEFITEVTMSGQNYSLSNYLRIAKRWDGDDWNGKMSNLAIFNRALSQEEIQANMYAELSGNESGLVGYWNFNDGTGNTLTDLSGNQNHGTIYGATWSTDVPLEPIPQPTNYTLDPTAMDFGTVDLGQSATQTLWFNSAANGNVEVTDIVAGENIELSMTNFTLWNGANIPVEVTFTPTVEGNFADSLVIVSDDPK